MFIEKGAKDNTDVYLEMLESKVLPWLNDTDWANGWLFQQDGAPSHPSNQTQQWCHENLGKDGFWPMEMWTLCSPDLNSMDFSF